MNGPRTYRITGRGLVALKPERTRWYSALANASGSQRPSRWPSRAALRFAASSAEVQRVRMGGGGGGASGPPDAAKCSRIQLQRSSAQLRLPPLPEDTPEPFLSGAR